MIKILAFMPDANESNSFWRHAGPLGYMSNHSDGEIQVKRVSYKHDSRSLSWPDFDEHDLIYLARPANEQDLEAMKIAYMTNTPVWIDWDDWVYDIPKLNPSYKFYKEPKTLSLVTKMIQCADLVTTTTQFLADQLKQFNESVVVLPNAYRSDLFSRLTFNPYPERAPMIFWRGSITHTEDILSVEQGMNNLPTKITFFGNLDWRVLTRLNPGYEHKGLEEDPIKYWHRIYHFRPKVWIVPLEENGFNRCKSNIAWMEALHSGAVCVAPNWPEWRKPGCITYTANSSASFSQAVRDGYAMAWDENRHRAAFNDMINEYDIYKINEKRVSTIEHLLNFTRYPKPSPFGVLPDVSMKITDSTLLPG